MRSSHGALIFLSGLLATAATQAATITATNVVSPWAIAGGGDFSSGTLSAGTYTGTGFTVAKSFLG